MTAVLLSMCITLPTMAQQAERLKKMPDWSVNISNAHQDSTQRTYLNLGLLSCRYNLTGIGINVVSAVSMYDAKGLQLSGLANISGNTTAGMQAAGIANVVGDYMHGLQVAGLLNVIGEGANGMQISGLGNIVGNNLRGVSISGLMNIAGQEAQGVQLSLLTNISGRNLEGVALSLLTNVSASRVKGVQLAGLLNAAGAYNQGLQIAGLSNVALENHGVQWGTTNVTSLNKGLQAGIVNIVIPTDSLANDSHGVQFGILNFSRREGIKQVGIINLKPHTRVQLILSGGNADKGSVAVRFRNKYLYTQIGAGVYPLGTDRDFSVSGSYRAGISFPLTAALSVSGDMGYRHIETLDNKHRGYAPRMYALQPRINLEYAFTRKFGIFASGGYEWLHAYKGNLQTNRKATFEVGIMLF